LDYVFNKTPRKADYVTFFAIILFALVIAFELLLVSWLPNQMMSAKGVEAETAKQEVIDLEDQLRRDVTGYKRRVATGEVDLVSDRLDQTARYLRLNSAMMNRDQTRDVMEDLSRFETIMRGWDKGKSYSVRKSLDTSKYLDRFIAEKVKEATN